MLRPEPVSDLRHRSTGLVRRSRISRMHPGRSSRRDTCPGGIFATGAVRPVVDQAFLCLEHASYVLSMSLYSSSTISL